LESERFALSKSESERDDESRAVADLGGRSEHALDLVNGQRFWLFVVLDGYGNASLGRWIGFEVAEPDRVVEGFPNDAMHLVDGGPAHWSASLGDPSEHPGIEVLQMLRPQRGELVGAHPRDQVNPHGAFVPFVGRGLYVRLGLLEPMLKPLLHGPPDARAKDRSRPSIAFEFFNLRADDRLRRALDVAPIRPAVIADADGDPSMPVAVRALVDAGSAVR
jgi:hypothetical protein